MHFDIVFLDAATPGYYDTCKLESQALGGTESSVIRLAEGLGKAGLNVAVIEKIDMEFEPIAGNYCVFLPASMIDDITCDAVVHLRSTANLHLFPRARKFVWMHDLPDERIKNWVAPTVDANARMIAVSDWHRDEILSIEPRLSVRTLYSPVDEQCYLPKEFRPQINKDNLVWNASPHKGLIEAIEVFQKLRKDLPQMTLTVMNPGYIKINVQLGENVIFQGETPRHIMRKIVASSLALFYPTQFKETFGLIAAEANAAGVPVATYKVAALAESVSERNGWCSSEENLIETIKKWRKDRPEVDGQERFRIRNILSSWVQTLDGR